MGIEPNLNEEIRRLKIEGKSLRIIATALGISHEAVRKRLKRIKNEEQAPNEATEKELTQARKDGVVSQSGSKTHKGKVSGEAKHAVNRTSTPTPPFSNPADGVNQQETASKMLTGGKKEVSSGVSPTIDDSITAIKEFIKSYGIEVYPMECEQECYQVKHNRQIIRFYVHRDKEMN
jgi:excisionase family DNA binding protein